MTRARSRARAVVLALSIASVLGSLLVSCGDDATSPATIASDAVTTGSGTASADVTQAFGEGTATPPVVRPGGTVRITPAVAITPTCLFPAFVYDAIAPGLPTLGVLGTEGGFWSGPDPTVAACLEQRSAAGAVYRVPDDWSGAYVLCLTAFVPEELACATVEVSSDGASFDELAAADVAGPCGVLFTETEYTSDRTCSIVDWNLLSVDGTTLELEYFTNDPGCSGALDHVGVQETVDDVTLTVYVEHLAGPGVSCPTALGSGVTTVQLQEPIGDKPLYGCRPELSFAPAGGYNDSEPRDPRRDCSQP